MPQKARRNIVLIGRAPSFQACRKPSPCKRRLWTSRIWVRPQAPAIAPKFLLEIAGVVRLVIVLREQFEHAVVIRLIADLEGVQDDEASAALESVQARKDDARTLGGSSWNRKLAVTDLAFILQGNGLRVCDHEIDPAPAFK